MFRRHAVLACAGSMVVMSAADAQVRINHGNFDALCDPGAGSGVDGGAGGVGDDAADAVAGTTVICKERSAGEFMSRLMSVVFLGVLGAMYGCDRGPRAQGIVGNPSAIQSEAMGRLESATGKTFPSATVIAEWPDPRSPTASPDVWVITFPADVDVDFLGITGAEPVSISLSTCVECIESALEGRHIRDPVSGAVGSWVLAQFTFHATMVEGSEGTYLEIQRVEN